MADPRTALYPALSCYSEHLIENIKRAVLANIVCLTYTVCKYSEACNQPYKAKGIKEGNGNISNFPGFFLYKRKIFVLIEEWMPCC